MEEKYNQNDNEVNKILKELAYENLWYIENRWTVEEQKVNALRAANKILAIVSGKTTETPTETEPIGPGTDPPEIHPVENFTPPEWLVESDTFPIVGRRFSPAEFIEYVKWVRGNEPYTWHPKGITMHHTAFPDLPMRPNGFTEQHMLNMRHGYLNDNKWRHGPHIFVDNHGIWVFNPLSIQGVHAVSYNSTRYGIEILGNFDKPEEFHSDRGIASILNGKFAAAVLMKHAGISRSKLNFHRHDPETSKTCPGLLIDFSGFEEEVLTMVDQMD